MPWVTGDLGTSAAAIEGERDELLERLAALLLLGRILGGILEARDQVGRGGVAGDAPDEQVSDGGVKDLLDRRAAVDAGEDCSVWPLSF